MTIAEATRAGIQRVRRPMWNERAYLRLDFIDAGDRGKYHGPWATLFDVWGRRAVEEGPHRILVLGDTDGTWLEYTGPIDPLDVDPAASPVPSSPTTKESAT